MAFFTREMGGSIIDQEVSQDLIHEDGWNRVDKRPW